MAVCLGCGCNRARVVWSYSAVVIEEGPDATVIERVCRRTTSCPPKPIGCGERRSQRITDEGRAIRAHPSEEPFEFRVRR
jgi:hypothetical protein